MLVEDLNVDLSVLSDWFFCGLQLLNWLWLRAVVWKSVYSTLPLLLWVKKPTWKRCDRVRALTFQSWCMCVFPRRMIVRKACQHLWRREKPVSRTSRKERNESSDYEAVANFLIRNKFNDTKILMAVEHAAVEIRIYHLVIDCTNVAYHS